MPRNLVLTILLIVLLLAAAAAGSVWSLAGMAL
jgi:hypothetical protein